MDHYTLGALICLCSYYVCRGATFADAATTGHKDSPELVYPHRVTSTGDFLSHLIPVHWVRSATEDDTVHFILPISGEDHHLELRPNRRLISPGAILETHSEDGIQVRRVRDVQCHFTGSVRGMESSSVAVSTCQGLAGYIRTRRGHFTIEPQSRARSQTSQGVLTDDRHPHLVYQRHAYDPGARREARDTGTKSSSSETRGSNETILLKREDEPMAAEMKTEDQDVFNQYTTDTKSDLYLEILVVLDKTFLNYHRDLDVENYILTIMNMAHTLFIQESLGRPVYLFIVRIIQLEHTDNEINLSLLKNTYKALQNFQLWQEGINPGKDNHPNHHDLAILFTRVDIYAKDDNHDLLGLARHAATCDPHHQGVICVDVGIALGYVVSHEIGHSLGFLHDDLQDGGCNATLPNGLNTVMSPKISISTGDWSQCSRKMLEIFIKSGFGHCLLDHPTDHPFEFVDELPGIVYDGDWQCRSRFGSNASLCDTAPRCNTMLCHVPDVGCIDTHTPPAPGTYCDDDKWCFNGECLQKGMRPGTTDGGWGPWSPWSKCTRTCGTGVSFAERRCDSPAAANGGEFCKGPKKKYKICNAEPCTIGFRFRDYQCSRFNNWIFPEDEKTHHWKASLTTIEDPCTLICVHENGTVAVLSDRVIDGTSCKTGIRDICIAGKCVHVPCDLNMDSDAVEDVCGVCHGDGTTCALKQGFKTFQPPEHRTKNKGKDEVLKLIDVPEGSQNINIEETEATKSRIEVRNFDGSMVFIEGDELGLYEVPGSRAWLGMLRVDQETLHIPGPVYEPLSIWVSPKQVVTFKYSIAVPTDKRQGAFEWDFIDWSACTSYCGVGTMTSVPKCVEQSSGAVDDRYCEEPKPKDKVKICENNPCATRWIVGGWSKCVRKHHAEASQNRLVRCAKPIGGALTDLLFVSPTLCEEPKPKERKPCKLNRVKCKSYRHRRRSYHRPNCLQSKNSKKIYLPTTKLKNAKRKERTLKNLDDNLAEDKDATKRFILERGRVDIDRVDCNLLKLTIKNSGSNEEEDIEPSEITTKVLVGVEVITEMELLLQNTSGVDPI